MHKSQVAYGMILALQIQYLVLDMTKLTPRVMILLPTVGIQLQDIVR